MRVSSYTNTMRQTQTTGRFGDVENGLQLDSAQPFRYYSNKYGDTSVRAGVGTQLWARIVSRMLLDLASASPAHAAHCPSRTWYWSDATPLG